MNLPCDKILFIVILLALLLVILGGVLLIRMNSKKLEDCGCDNKD